jgi:phage shock protein PspC (stress-responsive transcriptional regulator)
MKKALTITLNKILFYIEEDAYHRLHTYLESIKKTFASSEDKEEIMADIEARIAEQFQVVTKTAKQAVTIDEVEQLIRTMGTSEDIASDEPIHTGTGEPRKLKKLYRDTDNQIIAGVASGLAAYFGIDSVYVRLGFVILSAFSGLGVAIYVIMWIAVPEAQTLSQKMEMQGDPVTLKNLEEAVKARVDNEKVKKPAGKVVGAFRQIFEALGKVLRAGGGGLRALIGLALTIAGSAACVAATIAIFGFLINMPNPHLDPDFIRFILLIGEHHFSLVAAAAYTVAIIPAAMILLGGISLVRGKSMASAATFTVLIGMWVAAIVVVGITLSYVIPRFEPIYNQRHIQYYHDTPVQSYTYPAQQEWR